LGGGKAAPEMLVTLTTNLKCSTSLSSIYSRSWCLFIKTIFVWDLPYELRKIFQFSFFWCKFLSLSNVKRIIINSESTKFLKRIIQLKRHFRWCYINKWNHSEIIFILLICFSFVFRLGWLFSIRKKVKLLLNETT